MPGGGDAGLQLGGRAGPGLPGQHLRGRAFGRAFGRATRPPLLHTRHRRGSLRAEAEAWLLVAWRAEVTPCQFQAAFMCRQVINSCN